MKITVKIFQSTEPTAHTHISVYGIFYGSLKDWTSDFIWKGFSLKGAKHFNVKQTINNTHSTYTKPLCTIMHQFCLI